MKRTSGCLDGLCYLAAFCLPAFLSTASGLCWVFFHSFPWCRDCCQGFFDVLWATHRPA